MRLGVLHCQSSLLAVIQTLYCSIISSFINSNVAANEKTSVSRVAPWVVQSSENPLSSSD